MAGIDLNSFIDRYGGMISRAKAQEIQAEQSGEDKKRFADFTNIAALLDFIDTKGIKNAGNLLGERGNQTYSINIQDRIYRIFNPISYTLNNKVQQKRTIVLGSEGATIKFIVKGRLSEFIDNNAFERGDTVIIKNAILDSSMELVSSQNTMINKIMPAPETAIVDYSKLYEGMRNIDIIGKFIEIGPVRYVNRLGGEDKVAVSDSVITDLENSVSASLWGSSALATSKIGVNEFVKIEFCSVVPKNGTVSIYANDLSRVVASKIFEGRIHPALK
ncbi:MAG: hypothetical protein ACP5TL_00265 [Candidatus Micrarchaeia archaeon]